MANELANSLAAAAAAQDQKMEAAAAATEAPTSAEPVTASAEKKTRERGPSAPFPAVAETTEELLTLLKKYNEEGNATMASAVEGLFAIRIGAATTRSDVAQAADMSTAMVNKMFEAYNAEGIGGVHKMTLTSGATGLQKTLVSNFKILVDRLGGVASYSDARYLAGLWTTGKPAAHATIKTSFRRLNGYEPASNGANSLVTNATDALWARDALAANPDWGIVDLAEHMFQTQGIVVGIAPLARVALAVHPTLSVQLREPSSALAEAWARWEQQHASEQPEQLDLEDAIEGAIGETAPSDAPEASEATESSDPTVVEKTEEE
ncbi:MAG: hypothetical protein E6R03_07645 [Hyphomicrobiaceae bacterium]|nr:MAG: hypothetical protein E6R03_07645 [Hyphomicrobiaceae bacterium]